MFELFCSFNPKLPRNLISSDYIAFQKAMLRAVFDESEQKGLLLSLADKTPYGVIIDLEQLNMISSMRFIIISAPGDWIFALMNTTAIDNTGSLSHRARESINMHLAVSILTSNFVVLCKVCYRSGLRHFIFLKTALSPNLVDIFFITFSVADPDLELREGPGLDLLALPAIFPSVISSFFTQNKGGGGRVPRAPPLDPPLL